MKRHPTQVYEETFHFVNFCSVPLRMELFYLGLGLPTKENKECHGEQGS